MICKILAALYFGKRDVFEKPGVSRKREELRKSQSGGDL